VRRRRTRTNELAGCLLILLKTWALLVAAGIAWFLGPDIIRLLKGL
jgi:hypothetical protein